MDMDSQNYFLKDKISSQVTDSYYERNLRVLQQVQEKRASFLLGSRGQDCLTQTRSFEEGNERLNEISLELNSKSPDYSLPPPRYFTPVERAQSNVNDLTHHLVKPTPRHVGMVRPVQYPDRKICHPVPQALRRPRGSSPSGITGSHRLPPKKRPYIPTQEEFGPSSTKGGRMAIIDYSETSATYKYIPARVMDDYFRYLRQTETGMTTEDKYMYLAGNTNNNAVKNNLSGFMRELTTDLADVDAELDMAVAEIFNRKPEEKMESFQSPKEPWIPQITDDITAALDRTNLDMNNSISQQISPIMISLSPSNSHCNQTTLATQSDENSNFIQHISPVIISRNPGHSPCNQSNFLTFNATVRRSSSQESSGEKLVYPEPSTDLSKHLNTFLTSETGSSCKKKPSMKELCHMVLDMSADRPDLDRFTQTEEEQFADILEDFLEENKGLPQELKDVILDMLTKTRETVAEQKEGILYTAEVYKGESEDKANMDEFDRAADDEVMKLINEIELPDLSAAVTSESPKDALLDMDTNMRESMAEPTDGSLYSTDVFIGADDECLLAEFEKAVDDELVFEYTRSTELPDTPVHNITESSKCKFKGIQHVEVEVDSTGQEIYDEIAAFFGYDGYNDCLSFEYSALPDLPYEYSADEDCPNFATDDITY